MKKSGMEDAYLITIHSIYRKPVANSIFSAEKLEASNSQKWNNRDHCHHTYSNTQLQKQDERKKNF